MKTLRCILLALALVARDGCLCARAEQPTAEIRATTDHVLALLRDPALNTDARKSERRQLIRKELDQRVDWATIARSSLGRHWAKRTRAEQAEFVTRLQPLSRGNLHRQSSRPIMSELDKIDYLGEKIIDDYASVKAQVTTKDQVVHPVEYRLQKSGKDWRIYDVLLEGVSLVKNYRDQFDEILSQILLRETRGRSPGQDPGGRT